MSDHFPEQISLIDYKAYLVFITCTNAKWNLHAIHAGIAKRLDQTTFSEGLPLSGDAHSGWWWLRAFRKWRMLP